MTKENCILTIYDCPTKPPTTEQCETKELHLHSDKGRKWAPNIRGKKPFYTLWELPPPFQLPYFTL